MVAEYWIEAIKCILNDINYRPTQRLRGTVSLVRDETYYWWLMVEQSTQSELISWYYFKSAVQGKRVGASYIEARRHKFKNLVQGERSIAEYEVVFLRLSRYALVLFEIEYDKCVWFKDRLQYDLRVLITPQKEQVFAVLVKKVKIVEEVKRPSVKEKIKREI